MNRVFVIAEAGVNHNGDEAIAVELVKVAARCGVDAVKFQTFSADKLVAKGTAKAEYQSLMTGEGDQHDMLRALELSESAHKRLAQACIDVGIEFMSTPFDEEAARMLLSLGMRRIKVPSGEITNLPFLRFLASQSVPMILSTGMADMDEIAAAVEAVQAEWSLRGAPSGPADLTLLHCTSNYPAAYVDANLRAMVSMAQHFQTPVGYSDHTLGVAVSTAAVALGAIVIEKHFTLNKLLPGPDHSASLSPEELQTLVGQIRAVEQSLGHSEKRPTASELPIRALVRRSVTLTRALRAGEVLVREDFALLRPGTGIPPAALEKILGKRMARDLPAGATLQWDDLI